MAFHPVRHSNGSTDLRYSIDLEFNGNVNRVFVLRFCGEYVAASRSKSAMVMRAVGHNAARNGAATVVERR